MDFLRDNLFRKPALYPAELRGRCCNYRSNSPDIKGAPAPSSEKYFSSRVLSKNEKDK